MNVFKMTVDDIGKIPLTREIYIARTGKKPPYFSRGEDDKMRHYAVCPSCNNPVQVIGLVEKNTDNVLYARHIPQTILGLATYRQAAYDNCPLAAKNQVQVDKSARKSGYDDISRKILTILREHFDRVILVVKKATGIVVSQKLAEKFLEDYLAEEGCLYKYASLLNIPWMLAYMSTSTSLVGRFILDEDMQKAILVNVPNAEFSNNQLLKKGKNYLNVNVHFSEHLIRPRGVTVNESMKLVVSVPSAKLPTVIYEKQIIFDYDAFQYLLEIPEGKGTCTKNFWMWPKKGCKGAFKALSLYICS